MKHLARYSAGALLVLATSAAFAQDEGVSAKVSLGYLATSGNSESENLSFGFDGEYNVELWEHSFDGRAVRASTSGVTTAESYGLSWQSDREFGERSYFFARAAWDRNEFSSVDQQLRELIGYGRHLIDTERHKLDFDVGVGLRQTDLRDGTSDDESIGRISMDYTFDFSETASFEQSVSVESGSDNTYSESVTSLSADVWTNLAIVLSYTIERNSNVPPGFVRQDTFTAVSLEYSF